MNRPSNSLEALVLMKDYADDSTIIDGPEPRTRRPTPSAAPVLLVVTKRALSARSLAELHDGASTCSVGILPTRLPTRIAYPRAYPRVL